MTRVYDSMYECTLYITIMHNNKYTLYYRSYNTLVIYIQIKKQYNTNHPIIYYHVYIQTYIILHVIL